MINIEIGNSYSKINGLSTGQMSIVKKALSYEVDANTAYFSKAYKRYRRYLIDSKGNFPTGLLDRAVEAVATFASPKLKDKRKQPKSKSSLSTLPIDFWQGLYMSQKQALTYASKEHRGGIIMPTGTGKSRVIEGLVRVFGVRTLIVVPNLELKRQLSETLSKLIDSGKVEVHNIDSAALETATDFDCLIIDECHHSAAKTYQKLNKSAWNGIYYRFFLTATYFRNQENESMLFEAICGAPIYQLTHAEAVANKYIVPVEAHTIEVPPIITDAYTWAEVYSKLVVNHEVRNNLIATLLLKLNKYPTLCLVKEIAHGKKLSELTSIPFVSGEDDESRDYIHQFNNGRIKAIIGTTGIIGEGVDTKPAEFIIIAGLGKAKSAFLQQIGRGVRTYPGKETCKVVLFQDKSHKFTLRHYREQVKILKELGVEPTKLDIGDLK